MKLTEYELNREFKPKSDNQEKYYRAICENDIVICTGMAGTGKTACAVGYGITHLVRGDFDRLIITRPTIGTDEFGDDKGIGFLPGDMMEKMSPFVRPIFDELRTYFDSKSNNAVGRLISQHKVEIVPLCYARGRTFHNSFVICDEAQNCTHNQLKMIITRIGKSSKLVINGDIHQHDRRQKKSALEDWTKHILCNINGIAMCELDSRDVVRHPLISKILTNVQTYEMWREANEKPNINTRNFGRNDNGRLLS